MVYQFPDDGNGRVFDDACEREREHRTDLRLWLSVSQRTSEAIRHIEKTLLVSARVTAALVKASNAYSSVLVGTSVKFRNSVGVVGYHAFGACEC